jgi:Gluconate 2-dehydrogenase subunit 3
MIPSSEEDPGKLNRRDAIRYVSALLGGVAFTGGAHLLAALESASAASPDTAGDFTVEQVEFLDEIAETILPATKTPGAKAARVGAFMALMVTEGYGPEEQKVFRHGMQRVDSAMREQAQVSFMQASPEERFALLVTLDREAKRSMDAREAKHGKNQTEPVPYFHMMKELTLLGYFTSEIGCLQAQRYVETPGRFDPCVPYSPGEPSWAGHA